MNRDLHSTTIRARFSRAAPRYDSYAGIQKDVAQELIGRIPCLHVTPHILEIGCGTGQLTRLLRSRWPQAKIVAVDLAESMIEEAQLLYAGDRLTSWLHTDIMDVPAEMAYALVASNCALHWLVPLRESMSHIASLMTSGGWLAASVMQADTLREVRAARLHVAPAKPPLGTLPSHDDFLVALRAAGLDPIHSHSETRTHRLAGARELLEMLHQQGLTGGLVSRAALPLTRGELRNFISYYDQRFKTSDGAVTASYDVGYFIARKPL